jgi:hypothetical protein
LKLEKFLKTVEPFQFLLTWGDYEKDVPQKEGRGDLHVPESRLFALLQCTIMGAYSLLSSHSIVVQLLEYKNKTSWNPTFQRSKCTTTHAKGLQFKRVKCNSTNNILIIGRNGLTINECYRVHSQAFHYSIPSMTLQPLPGLGLPHKTPSFFSVRFSSPTFSCPQQL